MQKAKSYNFRIFKLASKYLRGDILEIGSGIGTFTKDLVSLGNVWSIEPDPLNLKKTKILIGKKAKVGYGDIEKGKYFFKDKKFDSAICLNVLEHIENDSEAIKNIHKLLKKNGKVFLLTPAFMGAYGEIDKSLGHYRRYRINNLCNLFEENNFEIVQHYYFNFLGLVGWFVSGRILRRKYVDSKFVGLFNVVSRITLPIERFIKLPFGLSCIVVAQK